MVAGWILLIGIGIQLALTYAVYEDTKRYGIDPVSWTTATFFLGIFGVLFYLLERPHKMDP